MRECAIIFGSLALLPLVPPVLSAEHEVYCDLRVEVVDLKDRPANALVTLKSESGEPFAQKESSNGIAEFCDVGFNTFHLVVRNLLCGEIVLRGLTVRWPHPRTVKVVLYSCAHDMTPPPGCIILLRVRDPSNKPLAGAEYEMKGKSLFGESDAYGRLWATVTDGSSLSGALRKEGYRPREVQLDCNSSARFAEKQFTLEKDTN